MLRSIALGLATLLSFVTATANAQFFSDQAAFNAQLQGASYLEEFNGIVYGQIQAPSWDSPVVNGYSWTVSSPGGLYSTDGAMSTNVGPDDLMFTFTGLPVTAFGGNFYSSDIDGNFIPSVDVTFLASDGATQTYSVADFASTFLGYVSNAPLVSVTLSNAANWVAADNVITGSAIPEPSSALVGLLGLAGLVIKRRRIS